ncbi:DUF4258 domain-containing protein [Hyunsoonleella pacifica]|uniref:DUF4258 domain-containing protein n=1 Tax=Hyunsoonleella pacifica TaxID=1080224 RepID=A0A4Q9FRG9_9FLAO|nr:DUF4258 domain-containing protein [Hyunsoonleella pacifica]TBN17687.1 DUF4258 domain-containing protein [Hyunsoonleella pacifica]GGD09851.1 hypothetical protein GCM10011368_09740 [Hyunsoonleella pacifica]
MKLIQRIGYYLGGFAIGLIILAFFLSGKKTSCAYGPEARVLKNINSKPFKYSNSALQEFDTITIKSLIETGDVNFSKSEPRQEPCGTYLIESLLNDKDIEIIIENCDSLVTITNLSFQE